MASIFVVLEAAVITVLSTYLVFHPKRKALEKTGAQLAATVILITAVWAIQAEAHITPLAVKVTVALLLIPIFAHIFKQSRPRHQARQKRT